MVSARSSDELGNAMAPFDGKIYYFLKSRRGFLILSIANEYMIVEKLSAGCEIMCGSLSRESVGRRKRSDHDGGSQ